MDSRVRRRAAACAVLAVLLPLAAGAKPPDFVTFESGQVRPLALSPDGARLFAVNTPDDRLEIFDVTPSGLTLVGSVPVGLEPVAVAARSATEAWVVNHLSDSASVVAIAPDGSSARVTHTLLLCDEPRDIVFGGANASRAFITMARRGQSCPVPALLTTPGVGRALVMVLDADAPESAPLAMLELFSDTPRALAVNADGSRVFAAAFHSGNQTTAISKALTCPGDDDTGPCVIGDVLLPGGRPPPTANVEGVPQPFGGLIVKYRPSADTWEDELGRDWSAAVRFDLPDEDVFAIDALADPPVQTAAWSGVGTILYNLAVNPATGVVYASNTEARNEIRFEGPGIQSTTVRGRFHAARITVLDGSAVEPRHLNKHIDYDLVPMPAGVDEASLSLPTGLEVSGDGAVLYVAALGSSEIGVFDTEELENDSFVPDAASHIPVSGGGPTGLALDEARERLYVFTRFDNGLSIVDTRSGAEVFHTALHDPEPPEVVAGRPFLYDARFTSSNGEATCAGCHVFGDFDSLAWDLGNPDAPVVPNPNPGGGEFHPLKGPLTTQSLRGLLKNGPMHWRGDRTGADDPTSGDFLDEAAAFRAFNAAFDGLLGRDEGPIPDADMRAFTDFALAIQYPPNPNRSLDNSLTPAEARGAEFAKVTGRVFFSVRCIECHLNDPVQGFFGAAGDPPLVPHFRNLYQKVGMFGQALPLGELSGSPHMGDQVRGFGFSSEGAVDTLMRFLHFPTFFFPGGDAQRRDVEAFLLAMDTNLAPIVGQQATLGSANAAAVGPRIDLLIASASAPLPTVEHPDAKQCDLTVKGSLHSEMRGWVLGADGRFQSDRAHEPTATDAELRAQAAVPGQELTYTCAPWGAGRRMGVDRDRDGIFDRDELDVGLDPAFPDRIPGGGPPGRDCLAQWAVSNPTNSPLTEPHLPVPSRRQACRDGDPLCDADAAVNGQCVFEVGVCFNVLDTRAQRRGEPVCRPADLLTWEPLATPRDPSPLARANAAALLRVVEDLGVTEAGARGAQRRFAPPLAAVGPCTEPAEIAVPVGGGRGGWPLEMRTTATSGRRDDDRLELTCLPGS